MSSETQKMGNPFDSIDDDRRSFERFTARFPAKIKDTRDNFGANISLHDASAEGAKLTTKERLYLNDSVALEVALPDGHDPMTLTGQVMWIKSKGGDTWDIGLRFHDISFMRMSRLYSLIEPSLRRPPRH